MLSDPDSIVDADAMGDWVFTETEYRVLWENKALDTFIDLPQPLMDNTVAKYVLKALDGRILTCEDISFFFQAGVRTMVQEHKARSDHDARRHLKLGYR